MPRFYFHLYNDIVSRDEEGTELADLEEARQFAFENARDLVCESIHNGHLNLDHRIDVADERGERVLSISFRDAFTIEG